MGLTNGSSQSHSRHKTSGNDYFGPVGDLSPSATPMANNVVELWLKINNTNHRALTIPLNTCTQFAVSPLTWLCRFGFTICGSKGHISNRPNRRQIADYPPDPVIQPGIYYYIAGRESSLTISTVNLGGSSLNNPTSFKFLKRSSRIAAFVFSAVSDVKVVG